MASPRQVLTRGRPVRFALRVLSSAYPAYRSRLFTPTFLDRVGNEYVLVDCWHHRVLVGTDLDSPISMWRTLADNLSGPHSFATDGELLVIDDTGRDRLQVFRNGTRTQIVEGLGRRPHRTLYDVRTGQFYVLASESQQLTRLINRAGHLLTDGSWSLPFLQGAYTRSMRIIDGMLVFVSGPGAIIVTRYDKGEPAVESIYSVAAPLHNMNDLIREGRWYYLTATPRAIVRTTDLARMEIAENLYHRIGFRGTPYYVTMLDGRVYVPEITEYSSVVSFTTDDSRITDVRRQLDYGPPSIASRLRRLERLL
jgi:hypothetical protein